MHYSFPGPRSITCVIRRNTQRLSQQPEVSGAPYVKKERDELRKRMAPPPTRPQAASVKQRPAYDAIYLFGFLLRWAFVRPGDL